MVIGRIAAIAWCGVAVLVTGCAGGTSGSTPAASSAMAAYRGANAAFAPDKKTKTEIVGIRLSGEKPETSPDYGKVLGYFNGQKSKKSEVVQLAANDNVQFISEDKSLPHTASFLGDATQSSAPWPSSFTGSSTASPAGTTIGSASFSTGTLDPGAKSAVYSAGAPGFYMFGCFYHYVRDGMRTVIIVQ